MDICASGAASPQFIEFVSTALFPVMAIAAIATTVVIAFSLMIGRVLNNAKLTLWAKTEIVQLFVSIAAVLFLGSMVNVFCAIDMGEMAALFSFPAPHSGSVSVFDAAETYLVEAGVYAHNALGVVRYHLQGYTLLSFLSVFLCDLRCFFGYSGTNTQAFGAYGSAIGALNIFFNSTLLGLITVISHLFLLLFVYRGFVLLFLPMGVFLRSMPYMRTFGSLLMAVAISFLIVYPLILSVFYLMGDVLVERTTDYVPDEDLGWFRRSEQKFHNLGGTSTGGAGGALWASIQAAFAGGEGLKNDYFPDEHPERPVDAIIFAASAFLAAAFMPTVALIGTIASISYITRMMGETIDLSRITRMI